MAVEIGIRDLHDGTVELNVDNGWYLVVNKAELLELVANQRPVILAEERLFDEDFDPDETEEEEE